jgi:hypothetical protein
MFVKYEINQDPAANMTAAEVVDWFMKNSGLPKRVQWSTSYLPRVRVDMSYYYLEETVTDGSPVVHAGSNSHAGLAFGLQVNSGTYRPSDDNDTVMCDCVPNDNEFMWLMLDGELRLVMKPIEWHSLVTSDSGVTYLQAILNAFGAQHYSKAEVLLTTKWVGDCSFLIGTNTSSDTKVYNRYRVVVGTASAVGASGYYVGPQSATRSARYAKTDKCQIDLRVTMPTGGTVRYTDICAGRGLAMTVGGCGDDVQRAYLFVEPGFGYSAFQVDGWKNWLTANVPSPSGDSSFGDEVYIRGA